MMPTETLIQNAFANAPQHVKDYILSDEMHTAFYAIRNAYKLHVDHAGNLALAIDAVILGLSSFDELPKLLAEGLQGVDAATQAKVVKDVNDKIFIPLREMTKKRAEDERKKEADAKQKKLDALRPSIRAVETNLNAAPSAPVPLQPVVLAKPVTPMEPTRPSSVEPAPSVLEQKMGAPVTQPTPAAPPPQQAPTQSAPIPPRYHGSDPYREPAE